MMRVVPTRIFTDEEEREIDELFEGLHTYHDSWYYKPR